MNIAVTPDGGLILSDIDRVLMTVLREAPEAADPRGDARALDRLYSSPANDEQEFLDDWQEYVQPDLQHLFESANETVRKDISMAVKSTGGTSVKIDASHVEAWISCLNQARLVLAERHKFNQEELGGDLPVAPLEPRDFALFQMHLYGFLLEALVQMEGGPEE